MSSAPTAETYVPRLKERYEQRDPPAAPGGARRLHGHGRPARHEGDSQHGRRRGQDGREGARCGDRRAHDHRRPARTGSARDEVDRELQAPRGDARRRARHAARRAHVRVPRPAGVDRAPAHPRLSRARPRLVRRSRQLLDRDPRADHLSGDRLRQGSGDPRPRRRDHNVGEDGRGADVRCSARSASRLPPREGNSKLAKKSLVVKQKRKAKYEVRAYTRCNRCGRPRAVYRKFGLCRICLRELAHQGAVPGMTKSSW